MYVRHLSVSNFRSYETAELPLEPGVTTLVGLNGQGKTNLVEAIGYLATLSSHRVASDAPLVRFGADHGQPDPQPVRIPAADLLDEPGAGHAIADDHHAAGHRPDARQASLPSRRLVVTTV